MAKSGLVSQEKLSAAFKSLSLKAEASHGFYPRPRDSKSIPIWCYTGTVELTGVHGELSVGFLDCSQNSGCWSWNIGVEKECSELRIGLARAGVGSNESLGNHKGGYACRSNGQTRSGRFIGESRRLPKFCEGDIVRITVDFDARTLNISVKDGEPHEAFAG